MFQAYGDSCGLRWSPPTEALLVDFRKHPAGEMFSGLLDTRSGVAGVGAARRTVVCDREAQVGQQVVGYVGMHR